MSRDWSDLKPRVFSALVLAVVGIGDLALGGVAAIALVTLIAGLIVWEAIHMFDPGSHQSVRIALIAAAALPIAWIAPAFFTLPLFAAAALLAEQTIRHKKGLLAVTVFLVLLSAQAFLMLRFQFGMIGIMWLVLVVIASDVAGYFAGRALGGPKFWPAVSPKKTWSGTIAGWIAAAIVGMVFVSVAGAGPWLVPISVAVAFAGQMGDIAESAAKRRMGVKDSSNLIPGHGGVWDRFDAMLAAALVAWLMAMIVEVLPVSA